MVLKLNRRFSGGLTMQWSYAFSKILTDSDTYYANAGFAEDQGNRRLEKSIGAYDQTHSVRLSTLYELPFGKGRRWLTKGSFTDEVLGGWRLSAIQVYASGYPIGVTRNAPLPIFNGVNRPYITTYDWKSTWSGNFDPAVDHLPQRRGLPRAAQLPAGQRHAVQSAGARLPQPERKSQPWKSFAITERFRLDFRAEAFNLLNRVVFSNPEHQPEQQFVRAGDGSGEQRTPDAVGAEALLVEVSP